MSDLDRRLASLFSRGVVSHDDIANGMAQSQAEFFAGETRRVERPQNYGFGSAPPAGFEIFAAFANGQRDAGVALVSDDRRSRPTDLRPGGVVLYGADVAGALGHRIEFTDVPKAGTIKIKCSRIEITVGTHHLIIDKDTGVDGPV